MHRDINKKRKARRLDEAKPLKSKSSSSSELEPKNWEEAQARKI